MSSKSHLNHCISAFAGELVSFVQRAQDSIQSLKRTVEQRPQAGVQDFKECLDDLEQQVADFTDEIQQLVGCTSDAISFEELIGHCTAVYCNNRETALALEQHLSQYGYQQAPGTQVEPENPDVFIDGEQGIDIDPPIGRVGSRVALGQLSGTMQQWLSQSTPSSPVNRSSLSVKYAPSRLGMSQPGSPLAAHKTPAALPAALWPAAAAQNLSTLGTVGPRGAAAVAPLTALQSRSAAPEPLTQLKQDRQSLGAVSNTSSTPAGLLISPGVAALANKYATSSAGGSSVAELSLPDHPSTGPYCSDKRSPCRDLSLSYNAATASSPDLPIFGMTPANNGSNQIVEPEQSRAPAADEGEMTPLAPVAREGISNEEDTTGELYSSLIHSNLTGMPRPSGDDSMELDQTPATPPCAPNSSPSSPKAPATAGRLPAEWHSKKMQELESLQADITLTLSQMKRTPSRSRLSMLASADRDDDSDAGQDQDQQLPVVELQPLLHQEQQGTSGQQSDALSQQQQEQEKGLQQQQSDQEVPSNLGGPHNLAIAAPTIEVAAPKQSAPVVTEFAKYAQLPLQQATVATGAVAQAAASRQAAHGGKAAAAEAAVSAAAAAAAAATADLESLMASLSMKYAPSSELLGNGSNAGKQHKPTMSPSTNSAVETATQASTSEQMSPQQARSPCSPATGETGLSADETSLIMKYAAPAATAGLSNTTPATAADTKLLPPAVSSSPDKRSRLAGRAAAAGQAVTSLSVASTASDGVDMRHSMASSCGTTPGKPRLAAALAAGMAAWRNAVHMDCPSPLSPSSPVDEQQTPAAGSDDAGAAAAGSSADSTPNAANSSSSAADTAADDSPEAAAVGEDNTNVDGGVGGSSLLTPTTQLAIKYAVEAAGLNTAANRPKSSIRRMQPTTDMSRLESMREQLHYQHKDLASSFDLGQQQQQQEGLAENLESRLAGAAQPESEGVTSSRSRRGNRTAKHEQQNEQQKPEMLLSLRKQKEHVAAAVLQKQVQQIQQEEEKLTPRAARLQRRQQVQQEQQHQPERPQGRRAPVAVLRSVGNTTAHSPSVSRDTAITPRGKASAAADDAGGSSVKQSSSGSRKDAVPAAVLVKVRPVTDDEFAGLPGWCKGLLSVDILNAALDELSEMMAGRAGKRTSSVDGFTAADLELLGHSSSRSKTIVSCLHKLSRATLQRSAAGSNIYRLVGTAV